MYRATLLAYELVHFSIVTTIQCNFTELLPWLTNKLCLGFVSRRIFIADLQNGLTTTDQKCQNATSLCKSLYCKIKLGTYLFDGQGHTCRFNVDYNVYSVNEWTYQFPIDSCLFQRLIKTNKFICQQNYVLTKIVSGNVTNKVQCHLYYFSSITF